MLDRQKIDEVARSWLGVRFKKGGRDRTGIDCVGLLIKVAEEIGIAVRDTTEYTFSPEPAKFTDYVMKQTSHRNTRELEVGSILLFKQTIFPMHTGILSKDHHGRWSVINANIKQHHVVEQPLDAWRNDLIAIRDFKEV